MEVRRFVVAVCVATEVLGYWATAVSKLRTNFSNRHRSLRALFLSCAVLRALGQDSLLTMEFVSSTG